MSTPMNIPFFHVSIIPVEKPVDNVDNPCSQPLFLQNNYNLILYITPYIPFQKWVFLLVGQAPRQASPPALNPLRQPLGDDLGHLDSGCPGLG